LINESGPANERSAGKKIVLKDFSIQIFLNPLPQSSKKIQKKNELDKKISWLSVKTLLF
jgi:hypothetical protein